VYCWLPFAILSTKFDFLADYSIGNYIDNGQSTAKPTLEPGMDYETQATRGTPGITGMYVSPLTSMATSNALSSRSVHRGRGAACHQRSRIAVSGGSSTAGWHTKSFNIPNELARYDSGEDDIEIVGVKNIRSTMITLKLNPAMPWGDHYDITPFVEGTAQRLVVESAATLYGNPSLSTIGGFFYTLYRKKDRVSLRYRLPMQTFPHCMVNYAFHIAFDMQSIASPEQREGLC
jgi:hypothetical protein